MRLGHNKYKVVAPAVLHLQSVPDDGSGWGEASSEIRWRSRCMPWPGRLRFQFEVQSKFLYTRMSRSFPCKPTCTS